MLDANLPRLKKNTARDGQYTALNRGFKCALSPF